MKNAIFKKLIPLMLSVFITILSVIGCKSNVATVENALSSAESNNINENKIATSNQNIKTPSSKENTDKTVEGTNSSSKPKYEKNNLKSASKTSSKSADFKDNNTSDKNLSDKTVSSSKTSSKQSSSKNITSIKEKDIGGTISNFSFLKKNNPKLPFDIFCDVYSYKISATVPAGIDLTSLKPTFTYSGNFLVYNNQKVKSGETPIDFSKTVTLLLGNDTIDVEISHLDTGLPSLTVSTKNTVGINSKTEYVSCSIFAGGGDYNKYPDYSFKKGETLSVEGKIKGRGWSSWYYYPKKSYTLKLESKKSILGLPAHKEWVLAANFADRSLIRNAVASKLATMVGMETVMDVRFVDLWVDGEYVGAYQLIEKIEIGKNRVDITDFDKSLAPEQIGYIVETNGHNKAEEFLNYTNGKDTKRPSLWQKLTPEITLDPISGDMFFNSKHYGSIFNVNKPSDSKLMALSEKKRNEYLKYIYNYMDKTEAAIKSKKYSEASKYLDMTSMAKWYIVSELSMNVDSKLHCSCYMYKDAGKKMKMGPLWDFDLGFGNGMYANENHDFSTYLDNSTWFKDLLSMPEFRADVKQVWNSNKRQIELLPAFITKTGNMLYDSGIENFTVWDINEPAEHSYKGTTENISSFDEQVYYVRTFTEMRISYMNNKISNW